jgi:hypothetical protein
MSNRFTFIFSLILAGLIVLLTYLTIEMQAIKKDYAELDYNHQLIKSQIKCAEKAFEILSRITKEGCVMSREDLAELESLNCRPSSI